MSKGGYSIEHDSSAGKNNNSGENIDISRCYRNKHIEEKSICSRSVHSSIARSILASVTIFDSVTSIGYYAFEGYGLLKIVDYKGAATDWAKISIGYSNSNLTSTTRYYYSEAEPSLNSSGTAYNGNYWHYDENGKVVVWKKEND